MNVDTSPPWHDRLWQLLAASRQADRLPHAILLNGAAGMGKSRFARRLSNALVCPNTDDSGDACAHCDACRQAQAGSHPDQHWVTPEAPGKMIKIDAVRQLAGKSVLAAQQHGSRVIVIDPADAMNRAAANALLKTLEEPAGRTVLVLVSSRSDRLPATIRSRCQMINFVIPDKSTARDWLAAQVADGDIDELLAISGGMPLRAVQAAQEAWVRSDAQLIGDLDALRRRTCNPVQLVEEWQKRPINLLFDGFKRCLADLVRVGSGLAGGTLYHPSAHTELKSLGQGIDLRLIYELNDRVLQLERDTQNNLNTQMMLEHLANRWLRITRPGGR